jgi:hypothetical protein
VNSDSVRRVREREKQRERGGGMEGWREGERELVLDTIVHPYIVLVLATSIQPDCAPSTPADAAHALQYAVEQHAELVSHLEEALDDETRTGAEFTCFSSTKALALLVQKHKY